MGLQETNLNWSLLPTHDNWHERTIGWWEGGHRSVMAHNRHDILPLQSQPGGSLLTSIYKAKHMIIDQGRDFRGLGRWVWFRYRGNQHTTLRIISAYRCGYIAGVNTVYSQQRRFFDSNNDARHPRHIMIEDLISEIKKWQEMGDKIILLIDTNEDITIGPCRNLLETVGLTEAILSKHQAIQGIAPTHQKGSYPIDGIFTSHDITIKAGGYLPFGSAPSDHRALWIEVATEELFGYKIDRIKPPSIRRLQHNNIRVVNRWIKTYEKYIRDHKMDSKAYEIQQAVSANQWNASYQAKYDTLLINRRKGIAIADKKCRKLCMGEVPWSMTLQTARSEIQLWSNVVSRKKGIRLIQDLSHD